MTDTTFRARDGDSGYILDDNGTSVGTTRFDGGDAPEVAKGDPGAEAATAALQRAAELGYRVETTGTDIHGRPLQRMVAPDGGPAAMQEMVADGLATPMHWKKIDTPDEHRGSLHIRGAQSLAGTTPSALESDADYRTLVEYSRVSRLNALVERASAGALRRDVLDFRPGDPLQDKSVLGSSFARGVDQTQTMLYSFADAFGSATGVDIIQKFGEEGVYANLYEAMQNPARIASYEDIGDDPASNAYYDAGIYALETIGEQAPQLLVDLAAGLLSGGSTAIISGIGKAAIRNLGGSTAVGAARQIAAPGVASAASRFGFVEGAKLGAFASMYMQSAGETQLELKGEGIDSPETALGVGLAKAALDYAPMMAALKGVGGRLDGDAVDSMGQLLKSAGGAVVKGVVAEGPTEAAQTFIDELAKKGHKPEYEIDETAIIDGGLRGAISGGATRGAGTAIVDTARMWAERSNGSTPTPEGTPAPATAAEPVEQLIAQAIHPNKDTTYVSPENADDLPALQEAMERAGIEPVVVMQANGGAFITRDPELATTIPADATTSDHARILGYSTDKDDALAKVGGNPEELLAVVVEDAAGNAISEEMVAPTDVEAVHAKLTAQFPGEQVTVSTPQEVVAKRRMRLSFSEVPEGVTLREAKKVEVEAQSPVAPEQKQTAPVQQIDPSDAQAAAEKTGVDSAHLDRKTPVVDTKAVRRKIKGMIGRVLPSGLTLRDTLDGKRIDDLTDDEVLGYARQLGFEDEALPKQRGEVQKLDGTTGPDVERWYVAAAAGEVATELKRQLRGVGTKPRADLSALAGVLGVESTELRQETYGTDNKARASYRNRVHTLVAEKFGSFDGLAGHLTSNLSAAELAELVEDIGGKQPAAYKFAKYVKPEAATPAAVAAEAALRGSSKAQPREVQTEESPVAGKARDPEQAKAASVLDKGIEAFRSAPLFRLFARGDKGRDKPTWLNVNRALNDIFAKDNEPAAAKMAELIAESNLTDPTVLAEARARIEGRLAQLATTKTEGGVSQVAVSERDSATGVAELEIAAEAKPQMDLDEARDLERALEVIEKIEAGQITIDTVVDDSPSGVKAYALVLSQLAQDGFDGAESMVAPSMPADARERLLRAQALAAAVDGLHLGEIGASQLLDEIIATTGLTAADLKTGGVDGTPRELFLGRDVKGAQRGLLARMNQSVRAGAVELLKRQFPAGVDANSELADLRNELLDPAHRDAALGVVAALLQRAGTPNAQQLAELYEAYAEEQARNFDVDVEGGPEFTANSTGIQTSTIVSKSEQEMSDYTFFGAVRRTMAQLAPRREWRRGKNEESIFDTHDVVSLDFESFYDTKNGYSLRMMNAKEYLADARFKLHGLSVARRGEKPRYLETEAEITAFVEELRSSDKPVMLVAHNVAFDGELLRTKFGFEPDVWLDTVHLSRAVWGGQENNLATVAQRLGMKKGLDIASIDGVQDLASLDEKTRQGFADYANNDVAILQALIERNEPGLEFARSSSRASAIRRNVPGAVNALEKGDLQFERSGKSQAVSDQLAGKNLLAIPQYNSRGNEWVNIFDATALAQVVGGGEKKPANPVEAYHQLLAALSRMTLGAEAKGISNELRSVRTFTPRDDVVIYIGDSGPVTFGEARALERASQGATARRAKAEKRIDELRDTLNEVQIVLDKLGTRLHKAAQTEASSVRLEAIDNWMRQLAGERIDREAMSGEVRREYDRLGRTVVAGEAELANLDGLPAALGDLFSMQLDLLSRMKAQRTAAKEAEAQGGRGDVIDEEQGARNEIAAAMNEMSGVELQKTIDYIDDALAALPDKITTLEAKRKRSTDEEQLLRSLRAQQGRAPIMELELMRLKAKVAGAREVREGRKVDGRMASGTFTPAEVPQSMVDQYLRGDGFRELIEVSHGVFREDPTAGTSRGEGLADQGDNPDTTHIDPVDAWLRAVHKDKGALAAAKLALAEAGLTAEPIHGRGSPELGPSAERPTSTPVEGSARAGHNRVHAATTNVSPNRVSAAQAKKPVAPLNFKNLLGNAYKFTGTFVARLRELNVPLDNVVIYSRETAQSARNEMSYEAWSLLTKALADGGSSYFNVDGRSYILIDQPASNPQQVLMDLAHEIGHATKDRVWGQLLAEDRAALDEAFFEAVPHAEGMEGRDLEYLQHEWFANQFMHKLIGEIASQKRPSRSKVANSPVAKAIDALVGMMHNLWRALQEFVGDVDPRFSAFAERLFAGEYRPRGVVAPQTGHVIRKAEGAQDVRPANRAAMALNRVRTGWKKGVVPTLRVMLGTVIGRIGVLNPQLADALYQRANADSTGTRAFDQQYHALRDRWVGLQHQLHAALTAGKPKKQHAAILQAALDDAFTGSPTTAAGKQARATLDRIAQDALDSGLRSVPLTKGAPIVAFSREVVEQRRDELHKLLVDAKVGDARQVDEMIMGILEGPGVLEGVIAPGLPVGAHATSQAILQAIPYTTLRDGGWLLNEHAAAAHHWADGLAKRTAWEGVFGGFTEGLDPQVTARRVFGAEDRTLKRLREAGLVDAEGRVFDPSAKFKEHLAAVRAVHGNRGADEVIRLLDGVFGRAGQTMPSGLRKTQDFVASWANWLVLAFSGFGSIPELATPLVRAGGRVGLSEIVSSYQEGQRLARDIGHVLVDSAERTIWQATGEQYQTPLAQKMNHFLFKWNGTQLITNISRTLATGLAVKYLEDAVRKGDMGALHRLNIDAETFQSWSALGRPAPSVSQSAMHYAVSTKAVAAVNQFVREAVVSPSRFQATGWGNHPAAKLIWHLKHFVYTYGDTILGGMWRDMKRRFKHLDGSAFNRAVLAALPAVLFGVLVLPLAAAALELRDLIRRLNGQRTKEYDNAGEYFVALFDRAGGFGPLSFFLNAYEAQTEYQASVFGTLSPTTAKVDMLFSDYKQDGDRTNAEELAWKLRQLTPVAAQNPGLWPFD